MIVTAGEKQRSEDTSGVQDKVQMDGEVVTSNDDAVVSRCTFQQFAQLNS
jgi:hypothetical protein